MTDKADSEGFEATSSPTERGTPKSFDPRGPLGVAKSSPVPMPPKPVPADAKETKPILSNKFGFVDEQGTVWVIDGDEHRAVGSYPDGLPADPFALYVRRYLDLEATIALFEARLPQLPPRDLDATLNTLEQQVVEPAAVGDLPLLRRRLAELKDRVAQRKVEIREERTVAREKALTERTAIVVEAEKIVAQPAERIQWKNSGQRLRELLEEWRKMQRQGPRLEKTQEDELWKRFSAARTSFDRGRRQYFAALDERQKEAEKNKKRLIEQAEALQNSTDWRTTSAQYRDLMDQWKKAGRASRKNDDALWARFRAAQQVFFDQRRDHERALDEEFSANLTKKEALAEKAEALIPVQDLDEAKKQLRAIQDEWEDAGQVPARHVARIEGRLRAVERAVKEAETKEWQRSDPETRARAEGMLAQLEDSISELDQQKAAALEAGDQKLADETENALKVKRMWLEQIRSSID